jgi:hypothetical protein
LEGQVQASTEMKQNKIQLKQEGDTRKVKDYLVIIEAD